MITRRASEIIRLAITMSQIQNTDALSWRDKVDMMNQSFIRLYDDLNNAGDLYFMKEVALNDPVEGHPDSFLLPDDFWKLLQVGWKGSLGDIVPIERAPNASQYFSGYRIVNNELIFNNRWTSPRPLIMRYIPQPQTITYPRPGYKAPGNAVQAAYDSMEDVLVQGNAGNITVTNFSTGQNASVDIEDLYAMALSAGIIYVVQAGSITCYDYELNELSVLEGTFDLYAHNIGWEPGIIIKIDDISKKYICESDPIDSPDYWNYLEGTIIKTITGGTTTFTYTDSEGEVSDITALFQGSDSFVIADPFIYVNKGGNVNVYNELIETDMTPAIIGGGKRKGIVLAGEVNNHSGYGIIYRDFYSGLSILGFADDTVLNYPKNIFFDWMVSDLAVKFRIACDIPTGELPALADDYKDTLMRGISRDVYMNPRISNVYGRRQL